MTPGKRNGPGWGTRAAAGNSSADTPSVTDVRITGALVATVTDDDHAARLALWGTCEQAPAGAVLVIRPAARVMPYGLLHGVPLLHLGRITVESADSAQLARWVSYVRAQVAQQRADIAQADADRVRLEADLERAAAAAAAWRAAHPEQAA